jgi:acyl-CoA synthetase (AMP-forming)/AMP-acid ligase II
MKRTELYADPRGVFLHQAILDACRRYGPRTALVDPSAVPARRITYAEYGEIVEDLARGLVACGLRPGEVVAICLPNSWEFAASYHAATLAGGIPTPMNPTYREREIRYQLANSGAAVLITDGPIIADVNLRDLPQLRKVYTARHRAEGTEAFSELLRSGRGVLPAADKPSEETVAALPYSSGTTGLPKGVMLSHSNLIANVYQLLGPRALDLTDDEAVLCFLPLYHIYGLNVALNPILTSGNKLVLMPRFQMQQLMTLLAEEGVTMMPTVPPALNAIAQAAEMGRWPKIHRVRWVKSGAAPLAPELARRFTALTGILINQGYGMTEASPVTHLGFLDAAMNRPASIGHPLAQTECRIVDDAGSESSSGPGELVMRGPQFMLGYWKEPEATAAVLRDGWYWSGDIVTRDSEGFYHVVDRRKEMIKYKGFPVAPAEVEAVLLEHPAVRDVGVVARPDHEAGEFPVAFVVLRDGQTASRELEKQITDYVADRLTHYKQPRQIVFVDAVPRTPSGKILRRELRKQLV